MANHVSSLKRARQTETRTAVNRANRSLVRGSLRSLREALARRCEGRAGAVPQDRLRPRQERAKRRAAQQHRLPLQVPPQRAAQGLGYQGITHGHIRSKMNSRACPAVSVSGVRCAVVHESAGRNRSQADWGHPVMIIPRPAERVSVDIKKTLFCGSLFCRMPRNEFTWSTIFCSTRGRNSSSTIRSRNTESHLRHAQSDCLGAAKAEKVR